MEDSTMEAKNLLSIQRIDPIAVKILDKATHAAVYKFNNGSRSWEKTDIDGAMFIYQRADRPFYSLMIANRQSLQDLIEPITPQIRIKMEQPYLFFCKPDGAISGLWFFKPADCVRVHELLSSLISSLAANPNVVPPAPAPAPRDSPLPSVAPPTDCRGLLDLLNKKDIPPEPNPATPRRPVQLQTQMAASEMPPMLQKLLGDNEPPVVPPLLKGCLSAGQLERDMVAQSKRSAAASAALPPSAVATKKNGNAALASDDAQKEIPASPSAASLAAFSTMSVHGSDLDAGEMTAGAATQGDGTASQAGDALSQGFPADDSGAAPLLDREQFVVALRHLLDNDSNFVSTIHQAYIDSLNARLHL